MTSDLADRVLPNTNSKGCQSIRDQLDQFKTEYEKLKSSILEAKIALETTISNWMGFDRSFEQLNLWVKETEMRVKSDSDLKADLAEKKAQLEKFKVSHPYLDKTL